MQYNIDVKTEVRKITSSKPVHAAAGAGALATQALRELPGRVVRGIDGTVSPWPTRASEYVQSVRAKAADQYDKLADHGKQVMNGHDSEATKPAINSKTSSSKTTSSRASSSKTK